MSDGNVVSGSVGELFNWIWVDIVFSIHLRAMLGIYISIFVDYHLSITGHGKPVGVRTVGHIYLFTSKYCFLYTDTPGNFDILLL